MSALEVAPDTRDIQVAPEQGERLLAQTWRTPRGFWGALTTVDHKIIGRRYIITAFVFLALGGVLAMLMRLQLARPEARVLSADLYNQVFTVHGSNMMFLFAVPVMEAMGVYLVPLMVGTRNIAFPRLNAFSYWIYLGGGILLWTALFLADGAGCRLVRLCAALRPAIRGRQARRHVGADDHLHRGVGAGGRGRDRGDGVQAARARACRSTAFRSSSGACWSRPSWSSGRCRPSWWPARR